MGCHLWGHTESDMTEATQRQQQPDAGRDWGQEEMGMTEDEMAGWHH